MNFCGKITVVHREAFLMKCFSSYADREQLQRMMKSSPLDAGMERHLVDQAARQAVYEHTLAASALSFTSALAPGVLRFAAVPIEYAAFLRESLQLVQKLLYLYTGMKQKQLLHHHQLQGYLYIFLGGSTAVKASSILSERATVFALKKLLRQKLYTMVPLIGGSIDTALTAAAMYQLAEEFSQHLYQRYLQHQEYLTIGCSERTSIQTPFFQVEDQKDSLQ